MTTDTVDAVHAIRHRVVGRRVGIRHRQCSVGREAPGGPQIRQSSAYSRLDVILKRLDAPDEVRHFRRGRFELVNIGGLTIGRATYDPGWRWSVDVGPSVGAQRCHVEHVGLVLQGRATAAFDDGRVWELTPGTLFHIPSEPHDSWVLGEEPYVSLHFLDAARYATGPHQ